MASEEKVVRKKQYVPDDDKDYVLCGVRIEDAENGVVIKCSYKLTEEAEKKVKADQGHVPYGMCGNGDTEDHVFEDKADAKAFINGELDELFGTGA